MRELLYQAYLRYPRAFYDRHATGQVVSRATNDLYPIRYFIGWGMTQGIQSLMMIAGIAIVLFLVNVKLAAIALVAMPAVFLLAFSFARKVMPISRLVQQLKADVTEAADEAVVGIEMVQAFGREDDVQARFADKAERGARRASCARRASRRAFLPGLLFLPTLSIGAVVYFGGHDVIGGALTYGDFYLFYQLLLQLVWPLEALGWILSLAQRATASASRSFAWLDGIETHPRAGHARVPFPGGGLVGSLRSASTSPTEPAPRCSRASTSRSRPARSSRLRPDRRREDLAPQPAAALLRPDRGARAARRRRPARALARRAAPRRRDRHAAADPLLDRRCATTSPRPGPTRRGRRSLAACEAAGVDALRRRPARRLRHADRRAWRQPLGRPAPARRARTRARRGRARDRARRPDVGGRHADRAPSRRAPPPRARRTHRADRNPAALDGRGRRSSGRARRRRHRRGRARLPSCCAPAGSSPRSSARRSCGS